MAIPVLFRRSDNIGLRYDDVIETDTDPADEPASGAELPACFLRLWLQTSCICIEVAGHSLDAELTDMSGLHAAEELCRFLALAPACYEELRLFPVAERSLTLEAEYLSMQAPDTVMHRAIERYDDLQAIAAALQRFADAYGLTVSVLDHNNGLTFLSVMRVRPWLVS